MVKAEILQFCETTSVKGVSRVVKSPSKLLRVLWLITVLLCLSLAAWQTSIILIEFSQNPVVTTFQEVNREEIETENLTKYEHILTFPTVTVCNTHGFSSNLSQYTTNDIPTFDKYIQLVNGVFGNSQKGYVQEFRSTQAYGAYIGRKNILKISHHRENLIVSCTYSNGLDCSSHGVFPVLFPYSHVCYSIPYPQIGGTMATHVDIILYLDNTDSRASLHSDMEKAESGAFAVIHDNNTLPEYESVIYLESGKFTTVGRQIVRKEHLGPPYGNCDYRTTHSNLYNIYGVPYNYTRPGCLNACIASAYAEHCGCLNPGVYATFDPVDDDYQVCTRFNPDNQTAMSEAARCTNPRGEVSVLEAECKRDCAVACVELTSTHIVSSAAWPSISHHLAFYNLYIKNRVYESYFKPFFEPIIAKVESGNFSNQEIMAELESNRHLIDKNFLRVRVRFGQQSFSVIKTDPKFTPTTLLAQMGATLNLYAGITIILVFEVLEFVYNVVTGRSMTKKTVVEDISQANAKMNNAKTKEKSDGSNGTAVTSTC